LGGVGTFLQKGSDKTDGESGLTPLSIIDMIMQENEKQKRNQL